MKARFLSTVVFGLALALGVSAQDASAPVQSGENTAQGAGAGGWQGQRGGWGSEMGTGRGIAGTVTEVASAHYTVQTDAGDAYTIYFSSNTRILKQAIRRQGSGERGNNPPQAIKPADIKVGDAVAALGEVDATAKTVGAVVILQLDPERAKQLRAMQADYGKTWLMGKVTAIDGVKVTLLGFNDNAAHAFQADENTTFRKRRDPITLADIHVGDRVRVEGAVKDGVFMATRVNVMGMPPGGMPRVPRGDAPETAQPPD